jgi:hypothetical protein
VPGPGGGWGRAGTGRFLVSKRGSRVVGDDAACARPSRNASRLARWKRRVGILVHHGFADILEHTPRIRFRGGLFQSADPTRSDRIRISCRSRNGFEVGLSWK